MSFIRGNDNLPRPEIFASHAGSHVLNRVVKRPIQGISRDGLPLDMPGYVGTYANQDGQAVPLGVVSTTYEVVQMRDLCELAEAAMMNTFTPEQLNEIEIRDSSANKGAFVKREYVIKAFAEALQYGNATAQIVSLGTTVAATCAITTGYDGGTSTGIDIGTLDLVCNNGMTVLNSIDYMRRRHTSGATIGFFTKWLNDIMPKFQEQVATMRGWAETAITWTQIEDTIRALPSMSERKAERLLDRAARECADRGFNVYALTSAFTYYSSHNSDEFPIRNTGNDNVATTLASRQSEVTRWVSSSPFQRLLAA